MENPILSEIPIYVIFLATVTLSFLCIEGGRRIGLALRVRERESSTSMGSTVGATLALLAFILAFTFGDASTRYAERKQLVIADANAIGTCYLRADFMPEAQRKEAQGLLAEWTSLHLDYDNFRDDRLEATLSRGDEIEAALWDLAVTFCETQPTPVAALFAASCNEVFDTSEERMNKGLVTRIPGALWLVLYTVSMLAMLAVGYQSGADGSRRRVGTSFLALSFATVLVTIADLDDGSRGLLQINQFSMQQLQLELDR